MRLPVLLLAVALLSGCSADEEPQPVPVPSASPSPSPSPSPSVVALPSPKETGLAGEVERAVLAYYAARNAAASSGSTADYRTTYSADCTACEAFADRLDGFFAKGQRFRGGSVAITQLRVVVGGAPGSGVADVRLESPDYVLLGADGAVLEEYEGSTGAATVVAGASAGTTKVFSVTDAGRR